MKDNFSTQSALYARFRPHYPPEWYDWLLANTPGRTAAWDVGTGNGQVALVLADHFEQVHATDISEQQLAKAKAHPHIHYAVEPAEQCSAGDEAFDLVVAAQAAHWFQFDQFYPEVQRVLRPGGLLVLAGYGLLRVDARVNPVLEYFYKEIIGPYWDAERRHVDAEYASLPFPFEPVPAPAFRMTFDWSLAHFIGYLNTWSAVQHFQQDKGYNPVEAHLSDFEGVWPEEEVKSVHFPIFMRCARMN